MNYTLSIINTDTSEAMLDIGLSDLKTARGAMMSTSKILGGVVASFMANKNPASFIWAVRPITDRNEAISMTVSGMHLRPYFSNLYRTGGSTFTLDGAVHEA